MTRPDITKVDHSIKPELRNGTRTCQCATCERFFTGVAPFDKHLMGATGSNPRCLTDAQMKRIGMVQNEHGVWQMGRNIEEMGIESKTSTWRNSRRFGL